MRIGGSENTYQSLASGRRINSAADDAAGLAISEKLGSQAKGDSVAINNMHDSNNLIKTAEGALTSIHDNLHRMRDLAVQASNGILSSEDRQIIQNEIVQIKESIGETVKNTQFNTQKLLDGSFADKNIAMTPQGTGMKMNIENSGLENLGIKDFDVTGNFDIGDIDRAIEKISEGRTELGATSNRLEHGISSAEISEYNQMAAKSRIADADIAKKAIQLNTQQIIENYKIYAQKQTMQGKANSLNLLL